MPEKFRAFVWNKKKLLAAQLLATGEISSEEIARRLGVGSRQLRNWKHEEEFAAKVKELVAEIETEIVRQGIARRSNRIQELNERWSRMQQVILERSRDPSMLLVPGGKTGLLCKQLRIVGNGKSAREVWEYEVDVALLRELREHEKQAAQELGQWKEGLEITGVDGAAIPLQLNLSRLTDEELDAAERLALKTVGPESNPGGEGPASA